MRSLRWVGLVSMLLIVGVLGGLMAPLSSDASPPKVTIQISYESPLGNVPPTIFTGPEVEIPLAATSGSALQCSTVDPDGGGPEVSEASQYNYCYPVKLKDASGNPLVYGTTTPLLRRFKLDNYDANHLAKVLVNDVSTGLELVKFTGTKFIAVDTWPETSKVFVTIKVKNRFNVKPQLITDNVTTFYRYGLRVGGTFTSSPNTAIGNISEMSGTGNFQYTFTVNADGTETITPSTGQPKTIDFAGGGGAITNTFANMTRSIAGPVAGDLKFDAGYSGVYPGFKCTNNNPGTRTITRFDPITGAQTDKYSGAKCEADVTVKHKFTIFGSDTWIFTSSGVQGGGNCGTKGDFACTPGSGGKKNSQTLDDALDAVFNQEHNIEDATQPNVPDAILCTPESPNTNICDGTLINSLDLTPSGIPSTTFTFIGEGPNVDNFQITGIGSQIVAQDPPFTDMITGRGGPDRIISAGPLPPVPNSDGSKVWDNDQIVCTSDNNTTIIGTDVVVESQPNGGKGPLVIHAIAKGDTVRCKWHFHTKNP